LPSLYLDGVAPRTEQDLNRRKATSDPEIVVHPEDENAFGERLVEIESRVWAGQAKRDARVADGFDTRLPHQ